MLGVDKLSSKAQPIESCMSLKLSIVQENVKVGMFKVRYERDIALNKGAFMEFQRMLAIPLAWGSQNKSSNSWPFLTYLMEVAYGLT